MKLKNKLFSVAAAGLLVFSNVTTAVVSANELVPMTEETHKAIYSSQPSEYSVKQTRTSTGQSASISTANVTISNVVDAKDTVEIKSGLTAKDIITIYDSNGSTVLGKGTSKGSQLKITLKSDLGTTGGTIQISRKAYDANTKKYLDESEKVTVNFARPAITTNATGVTVVNNTKSKDEVSLDVTGLEANTVVSIYNSTEANAKVIGKYTHKDTSVTKATVNVKLDDTKNVVAISSKVKGKLASDKFSATYQQPEQSEMITTSTDVKIVNNVKSKDTITVTGATGDIIEVYSKNSDKPLAKGTIKAPKDNKDATTGTVVLSTKFETKSGDISEIYITRTSIDKRQSTKATMSVAQPEMSSAVTTSKVTFINNEDNKKADVLFAYGLDSEDVINIYESTDTTAKPIGVGKVAKGETQTYIKLKKKLATDATIYISRSQKDKAQTTPVTVDATK